MPGASPLDDPDMAARLEDAGASAIVMQSLFEEEIAEWAPATDRYLKQLQRLKHRVRIPVIASLNGTTSGGWLQYAMLIQRGGADALEQNFYHVAADLLEGADSVERRVVDIVAVLKESIAIPLAVKLSPFYSALPHLAHRLDMIGADGLVLFNRFYQPDIDPDRRVAVRAWDTPTVGAAAAPALDRHSVGAHRSVARADRRRVRRGRRCQGVHGRRRRGAAGVGGDARGAGAAKCRTRRSGALGATSMGFRSIAELRGTASLTRCADPRHFGRQLFRRAPFDAAGAGRRGIRERGDAGHPAPSHQTARHALILRASSRGTPRAA